MMPTLLGFTSTAAFAFQNRDVNVSSDVLFPREASSRTRVTPSDEILHLGQFLKQYLSQAESKIDPFTQYLCEHDESEMCSVVWFPTFRATRGE